MEKNTLFSCFCPRECSVCDSYVSGVVCIWIQCFSIFGSSGRPDENLTGNLRQDTSPIVAEV